MPTSNHMFLNIEKLNQPPHSIRHTKIRDPRVLLLTGLHLTLWYLFCVVVTEVPLLALNGQRSRQR